MDGVAFFRLVLLGPQEMGGCGGLLVNVLLSLIAIFIGCAIGFPLACVLHYYGAQRLWWYHLIRRLVLAVPLVLLVFWCYFLVPLILGWGISGLLTGMCALSLYAVVYLAEVFRSGLYAVPAEQWQMAGKQGLGTWDVLRYIIVPQAVPVIWPSLVSFSISLFKDSTVVGIVGVVDLTQVALILSGRYPAQVLLWYGIVGLFFFIICSCLSWFQQCLENKVANNTGF